MMYVWFVVTRQDLEAAVHVCLLAEEAAAEGGKGHLVHVFSYI